MTTPVPNSYLTVKEIARHLRVSPMTVYRLIHTKELKSIKVGATYRVHRQAIAEYLNPQERAA